MEFQISFRKIKESDLSVTRPFMPEEDDYEMYLAALIEDIENFDCVIELNRNESNVIITVENESGFDDLHGKLKELLTNFYHDKLVVDKGFSKVSSNA